MVNKFITTDEECHRLFYDTCQLCADLPSGFSTVQLTNYATLMYICTCFVHYNLDNSRCSSELDNKYCHIICHLLGINEKLSLQPEQCAKVKKGTGNIHPTKLFGNTVALLNSIVSNIYYGTVPEHPIIATVFETIEFKMATISLKRSIYFTPTLFSKPDI